MVMFLQLFPRDGVCGGKRYRGKIYEERIKGGRERRISSGEKGVLESRREGSIKEGFLEGQTQSFIPPPLYFRVFDP